MANAELTLDDLWQKCQECGGTRYARTRSIHRRCLPNQPCGVPKMPRQEGCANIDRQGHNGLPIAGEI